MALACGSPSPEPPGSLAVRLDYTHHVAACGTGKVGRQREKSPSGLLGLLGLLGLNARHAQPLALPSTTLQACLRAPRPPTPGAPTVGAVRIRGKQREHPDAHLHAATRMATVQRARLSRFELAAARRHMLRALGRWPVIKRLRLSRLDRLEF